MAVALCSLIAGPRVLAQAPATTPAPAGAPDATKPSAAAATTSLAHYVPSEDLDFYVAFDGLDAHADAWHNTAAYKMLTTTPLGVMLEEVAAQILDRILDAVPNRRITGAEGVTLVETMTRKGWVYANNLGKDGKPATDVIVLRGMAAKEQRLIFSKVLGMIQGSERPKTERRGGRMVVPATGRPIVWWAEKDDIVICDAMASVDRVTAALDGKAPSAVDHPVLVELMKPEGTFRPLMTAFMDVNLYGQRQLKGMPNSTGISRVDYRWGFDDEALMSVVRIAAPSPRKPALAIFDQPKLDLKKLIPIPDGVESFVTVSASPERIMQSLSEMGLPGGLQGRLEEVLEKAKGQTTQDLRKDFLGNLGPRFTFYLAPGRSAAATDETPKATVDPMAMLSSLQSAFPKPTLVAEIRDPVAFGKALDSVVLAINKEFKARAVEAAAAAAASTEAEGPEAGPGRPRGNRGEAGERNGRRKSNKETPAPELRPSPSTGSVKAYMLVFPPDSPIKFSIPGVRPSIRVDGKYIALASTPEAGRVALEAIKKKDWKPSADVEQALGRVPSNSILLAVDDTRSTMPAFLSSLPGTLQTMINTMLAISSQMPQPPGQFPDGPPGAPGAMPGGPGMRPGAPGMAPGGPGMAPGGPGMAPGSRPGPGGRMLRGPGGGEESKGGPNAEGYDPGGQPPSGYPGAGGQPPAGYPGMSGGQSRDARGMGGPPQQGGPGGNSNAAPAMIEIKVDPAKLPRAEDLKALMFPSTIAVTVDEQSIKLVMREPFPNLAWGVTSGSVGTALLMPAIQAARKAAQEAAARNAGAAGAPGSAPGAGPAPAGGQPPAAGSPGGRPGGPPSRGGPGGPGRRGRDE